MLPQIYRLTYQKFFQNPSHRKFYRSVNFDISTKLSQTNGARFTISVPKSLDKRSSYRNRTKRIIQECLRNHLKNIHTDIDIMIKSKKILKKINREFIEKELIILLGKTGVS